MYKRFLNDSDYLGVTTKESLTQITRNDTNRFIQAEESAEASIIEYLSENYEVQAELNKGKYIAEYDRKITFPIGVHIYYEGRICEVIRSISGHKIPADVEYWEEYFDENIDIEQLPKYSQFATYHTGDIVIYNESVYKCLFDNGYKFNDIRIPMVYGWKKAEFSEWQPITYNLWDVVKYNEAYYTLLTLDAFDNNINPLISDNWGAIADYDPEYNDYELIDHEYVVFRNKVYYPEIDVNCDLPEIGKNLAPDDPRNYNLKKHMTRLAMYELVKLIAPNNVSEIRIKDYEDSMKWLSDASKLKINPQIPRKLGEDNKPVLDWQLSTFQANYDPYQNPWLT